LPEGIGAVNPHCTPYGLSGAGQSFMMGKYTETVPEIVHDVCGIGIDKVFSHQEN
jgi:hypothetical protein